MISLGYNQYQTLAPLFDEGSPVHLKPIESYPGNIVDLIAVYFEDEVTQNWCVITADGDRVSKEEWTGQMDHLLDTLNVLKPPNA